MKKKVYDENDEIELRLTHNVEDHYWLEWRFKQPREWWFFKIYDKWKSIYYYLGSARKPDSDPNDDHFWYWRGFHLGKKSDVQEYEKIKKTIKTKKELFDYFNVVANIDTYYRDLHDHHEWLKETNAAIEKLTGK